MTAATFPTAPAAEFLAATTGVAVFDVADVGTIEAAGSEAAVFLHNLCTADVKRLPPSRTVEAFFCTATAKLVAHTRIRRMAPDGKRDTFRIDVDAAHAPKFLAHLDRYLISEDVTLTDLTGHSSRLLLVGPQAVEAARAVFGDVPTTLGEMRIDGDRLFACIDPTGTPAIEITPPPAEAEGVKSQLVAAGAVPCSAATYHALRVLAGVPLWGVDLDETTFAPEASRTATAIRYDKGCYLGQEPIVMARDRGVVQRGIQRLATGSTPLSAGELLYRDGKEVGRVTSSVVHPATGEAFALAYVKRGSQNAGQALEAGDARVPVTVSPA